MATNTDLDKQPMETDSEDNDDSIPVDAKELFVTEPGQICYDCILPRDFNTTTVPTGYGMLRASRDRRKLWHKKTPNVCVVEKHHRELR